MRIDIYARWRGQTEEEREAQLTDLSISHGRVGHLREVYDEPPYATHVLVRESLADDALD